jgi:pimeloyl-ACP methyl ester carboxylesterase
MAHITFIHGISNKPELEPLRTLWLRSLARDDGFDCDVEGITTTMVYWADVLYASPLAADETVEESTNEPLLEARIDAAPGEYAAQPEWRAGLPREERDFVEGLANHLGTDLPNDIAPPDEQARGGTTVQAALTPAQTESLRVLERVPLPWFIKRRLMKLLLRDVHHYLFDSTYSPRSGESFTVQEEIRRRFVEALQHGSRQGAPHVVVSHSMGTVIAYDCLKRVPDCPSVDALFTIGSPLGLDEIQDKLSPEWSRDDGFAGKVRGPWINVYDALDPVAGFDPAFANDYRRSGQRVIEDIEEANWGHWRHSISKYLAGSRLRGRIRQLFE